MRDEAHTDEMVALAAHLHARAADAIEVLQLLQNFGKSFGSFCKSASSVNKYFPRAALRPAKLAALSPH